MPAYMLNALFITVGLLLERVLFVLLRQWDTAVSRTALHALMGLTALLLGNGLCPLFGASLGLNVLTVPTAALLGLPGVVLLWAVGFFV